MIAYDDNDKMIFRVDIEKKGKKKGVRTRNEWCKKIEV